MASDFSGPNDIPRFCASTSFCLNDCSNTYADFPRFRFAVVLFTSST
jgi:hypothetical protein